MDPVIVDSLSSHYASSRTEIEMCIKSAKLSGKISNATVNLSACCSIGALYCATCLNNFSFRRESHPLVGRISTDSKAHDQSRLHTTSGGTVTPTQTLAYMHTLSNNSSSMPVSHSNTGRSSRDTLDYSPDIHSDNTDENSSADVGRSRYVHQAGTYYPSDHTDDDSMDGVSAYTSSEELGVESSDHESAESNYTLSLSGLSEAVSRIGRVLLTETHSDNTTTALDSAKERNVPNKFVDLVDIGERDLTLYCAELIARVKAGVKPMGVIVCAEETLGDSIRECGVYVLIDALYLEGYWHYVFANDADVTLSELCNLDEVYRICGIRLVDMSLRAYASEVVLGLRNQSLACNIALGYPVSWCIAQALLSQTPA